MSGLLCCVAWASRSSAAFGGFENVMRVSVRRDLLVLLILVALCLTSASAQVTERKVFDTIPISQRERFISRLNLYVQYLLKNQQAALETLYDEDTLCRMCKGKHECTENCAPPMIAEVPEGYDEKIVAFKPRAIRPDREAHSYAIEVVEQARVSWKGKPPWIRKTKVHVYAILERGDWYFSLVAIPGTVLM